MIPDNGQHVIISHGYGSFAAYPCTVEIARGLLAENLENLDDEVQEVAKIIEARQAATVHLVIGQAIVDALVEITSHPSGTVTKALRRVVHGPAPTAKSGKPDTRPEEPVTDELRNEVVLWAFKKGLNPQNLKSIEGDLESLKPHEELSFLASLVRRAEGKPVRYVRASTYESASTFHQVQYGKWKETAQEHRVVQNILEFIRDELAHRDQRYDIAPLNTSL